jgi:hypothetical protein
LAIWTICPEPKDNDIIFFTWNTIIPLISWNIQISIPMLFSVLGPIFC